MKLAEFAKKLSCKEKNLMLMGLEDESSEEKYAEQMKDVLLRIRAEAEALFHPEVGFASIIEHGLLSELQKKKLFKIFKESSKLLRDYEVAKLESKLLGWAINFLAFWEQKKESLLEINKDLANKWEHQDSDKMMLEYLG